MDALTNSTPLAYELHVQGGKTLKTIADAALFIMKLPKEHDGRLHWTTAGANLESAARHPEVTDLLLTATQSLHSALATEKMLK